MYICIKKTKQKHFKHVHMYKHKHRYSNAKGSPVFSKYIGK